jgi:hypothetical protein
MMACPIGLLTFRGRISCILRLFQTNLGFFPGEISSKNESKIQNLGNKVTFESFNHPK